MAQRAARRGRSTHTRLARAAAAGLAAVALASSSSPASALASASAAATHHRSLKLSANIAGFPPLHAIAQLALGAQPVPRLAAPPFAGGPQDVTDAIERLNERYMQVHLAYEKLFWNTKMAIPGANNTADALAAAKTDYDSFMGDKASLATVRALLQRDDLVEKQRMVLDTMKRTFELYTIETAEMAALKAKLNSLEASLGSKRDDMVLGMHDPKQNGTFVAMSSVQLRNTMRVAEDEATRKACYEGMREVGPFVAADLAEIVKLRNKLARAAGYEDYYDYKVQAAEQVCFCLLWGCLGEEGEGARIILFSSGRRRATLLR
jgi:hypothetical protein